MFRLQKEQNKFHENQHNEMMEILKTPLENQCFAKMKSELEAEDLFDVINREGTNFIKLCSKT